MTVATPTSSVTYVGTGGTSVFPFTWQVNNAADLVVYTWLPATGVITQLALNTGYTLTGIGSTSGGTVTLVAGNLPSGTSLFIASDPALVQPLTLNQAAAFNASDIMNQLDYLTREVQAARRIANNGVHIPAVESLNGQVTTLPAASQRATKFAYFDAFGNATAVSTYPGSTGGLVPANITQLALNIAALRGYALAPMAGYVVATVGAVTAGDGGGSGYYWNATDTRADNGSTIIQITGTVTGRWNALQQAGVVTQVANVAALRAYPATPYTGASVATNGYYTAGDGGAGVYTWNATDTRTDNGGSIIQITGVATGRWNMLYGGTISVMQFGALVNGVNDDTTAIQAAITWAQTINGGTIIIPAGKTVISGTLVITGSNVRISGAGGDTYHDGGIGVTPATRLQWAGGAAPIIQFKTASGGGNAIITGNGLASLAIDGNAVATYGLDIYSIRAGVFEDLYIANVTVASYHTNCGVTGTYSPEACDVQLCRFSRCTWRNIDFAAVQGACGFYLDGSSNADTSLNVFELCQGQTYAGTVGSVGFLLNDADNNVFIRCSTPRIMTVGAGLQINGTPADSNHFLNCTMSGTNGIVIKGTASGFVGNSVRCCFYGMDGNNGTAPPVYDAGCIASFHLDTGVNYKLRTIQACLSDSTNYAAAIANIGSSSTIIDNSSQNHLLFSTGGAAPTWGINVDGSGNVRLNRQSGTGLVNIGNGADMMFGGMHVTYGTAPPSSGTWSRGDKCWQSAPAVGSPKGWLCTVAGSPGTWVSEGNL